MPRKTKNDESKKVTEYDNDDDNLIGFINVKDMDRFLAGEIRGVPIKKPIPDSNEWEVIAWINPTRKNAVYTVSKPKPEQ